MPGLEGSRVRTGVRTGATRVFDGKRRNGLVVACQCKRAASAERSSESACGADLPNVAHDVLQTPTLGPPPEAARGALRRGDEPGRVSRAPGSLHHTHLAAAHPTHD